MTSGAGRAHSLSLRTIAISELEDSGNILQSEFWGKFRAGPHWTPLAFHWEFQASSGRFLLLLRRFQLGLKFAYIPYGPKIPDNLRSEVLSRFLCELAAELKAYLGIACFFLRFDLAEEDNQIPGKNSELLPRPMGSDRDFHRHVVQLNCPLRRASHRVQPQSTVILNLGVDEKQLLTNMHRKTRYNIGLAARKGVVVSRYAGQSAIARLSQWYRLYQETASRDRISVRDIVYYKRLFEISEITAQPQFSLYIAEHHGDTVAGIIVARFGGSVTYMYGASGALKREMMPNHLLQWTAIRDAKTEGATEYDFFGIPRSNSPNHPMHGLWRFKMGFGGTILHYLGAWDYPYGAVLYRLFRCVERLRGYLIDRRKTKRNLGQ
ncbi:hypothetical protein S1OALGB6SA_117 [Olavius algarvensis spirochete endosymbiont]|uniref:lipid II:glycine glycyltransferase FemX n=1 Tax=Olavius algarvensis spirochete endosymbiont TaxID=260710 RepID=UPI000F1E7D9A|nr:peptidoglycan bridge formation glycyltransferase FemA/FemB family protein [Olavius algarvensis spirochete endosymbiont]CAD7840817.1 MAG: hypothetical protein [Olavius algarvensis spirochete endosymbiont]VDA99055.1 hypothetical protein S1OALGB6SA_117 [Olavius algarvensis spirochete endosymbiont]